MKSNQGSAIARYISSGNKQVEGWFFRVDAEIFRAVLEYQSAEKLPGSMVEIGVHHGRSFIEMCLGLNEGERGYCVDVFEAQDLNIDQSGEGDRKKFEENMQKFGVDLRRISIDPRSSIDVKPSDIVSAVGLARFFSVDGGHWLNIVKNDLALAENCLAPHGIIALDDFVRAEWPDVSAGYFAWYPAQKKSMVPFAIGGNKLYLCESSWAETYSKLIANDEFLKAFRTKLVHLNGVKLAVYQEYSGPDWPFRKRALAFMKLYHPEFFIRLKTWRANRRKAGGNA